MTDIMKILFIGPMGAGKTTAIRTISDIELLSTEVINNDTEQHTKATTTVALDYGEVNLGQGETVLLYGIPGQERFSFMWPVLAEGALGAILLINDDLPNSQQHLTNYINAFPHLIEKGTAVIGVWSAENLSDELLEPYRAILKERELALPIIKTDVRVKENVLTLIEMLIVNIEVNQLSVC